MYTSIFYSAAFAAVASAQSSSSIDAFPQTSLLQQTNSLGVVTGMFPVATSQPSQPAVATSQPGQPAVVTSQPLPANIPAVGSGITTLILPGTGSMFNQTRTVVVSANNSTTIVVQPTPAGASGSGASGSGAAATGSNASKTGASASKSGASGSSSSATTSAGAAANLKVAGGAVGLGAFLAALL